jgi:hypothetical protein
MGTFAETAVVDYRLSFADQGKQTFVSLYSKRTEVGVAIFRYFHVPYMYLFAAVLDGKRKPR